MKMTIGRWIVFGAILAACIAGYVYMLPKAFEQCRKTDTVAYCSANIKMLTIKHSWTILKGAYDEAFKQPVVDVVPCSGRCNDRVHTMGLYY